MSEYQGTEDFIGVREEVLNELFQEKPPIYIKALMMLSYRTYNVGIKSIKPNEVFLTIQDLQKDCGCVENGQRIWAEREDVQEAIDWLERKNVIKCSYTSSGINISFEDVIFC